MDRLDQDLDRLFAEYREATPAPEASAEFMPRLWGRIEAKRSFVYRLKRVSQLTVAAALAASLVAGALIAPLTRDTQVAGSYVDVLADAHPDDALTAMGGIRIDLLDKDQSDREQR
jgi:hypothetical protein